ncbi:MAG TPA: hypothetical protein EYQ61_11965 [Dehalococcoidia bacterium]|nr:hypothetical protein [Dehalococcoidia bacterium]HIK88544.1 hypothetical protein [Dehalococcoidia bacterium]
MSLARAIGGICGVAQRVDDPVADRFRQLIGEPEHLVFVIADGFGMNFVDTLPEDSFSRTNLVLENRVAFPSSTGPNLFSFGRAEWPGQYGAIGWYVHLGELNARATLFPWVRTKDDVSLTDLGLTGEVVWPGVPESLGYKRDSVNYIPSLFSDSVATGTLHGRETVVGYEDLGEVIDRVVERVRTASQPTYSHIFWPRVDNVSHEVGTRHQDTLREVAFVDAELGRFAQLLPKNAGLVVTADHGHLDMPEQRKFVVEPDDPLTALLVDAPSGDERTLMFHVVEGQNEKFATEFMRRFGEHFLLLTADDVVTAELLGPDLVRDFTLARLGTFKAIARYDAGMKFRRGAEGTGLTLNAQHGGLTPAEMLVPVIVA